MTAELAATATEDARAPLTAEQRAAALAAIAEEVRHCQRCPLSIGRTNAVPGEGHPDTEVVFVGEGPGFNEDQQGRPFVGAAGSLLNELLKAVGWRRDEVFITNVVKCRPPANRDPEPHEIEACAPYLRRQLEVLDPAMVVTLGRHSLQTFRPGARIGQVHGTQQPVDPSTGAAAAMTYSMYHPAAALRQGSLKETMLADMAHLPEALLDARARRQPARPEPGIDSLSEPAIAALPLPEADAMAATETEASPTPADALPAIPDDQMSLFQPR